MPPESKPAPPSQQDDVKAPATEKPDIRDEAALPAYPAEFLLTYNGIINQHGKWKGTYTESEDIRGELLGSCNTTVKADGYCELRAPYDPKQLGIGGVEPRLKFRLHARDNRYAVIEIYYGGHTRQGVSWPELVKGVKIADALVRAIPPSGHTPK